jgi:hypothetical protein
MTSSDVEWVNPDDLDDMAATTNSLMPDKCNVFQRTVSGRDSRNREVETYPLRHASLPCSYNPKGGREIQVDTSQTIIADASVRLPLGSEVRNTDKVEITARFGRLIAPLLYKVVGYPDERATAILVQLQKVGG